MSVVIDVHHHILPDFFWRETNDNAHPVGGIAPPAWDEASALAFMDDAAIDVATVNAAASPARVRGRLERRSNYILRSQSLVLPSVATCYILRP